MRSKPLPPLSVLQTVLRYDPNEGSLIWQERTPDIFVKSNYSSDRVCKTWNGKYAGKTAGSLTTPYQVIKIFGEPYKAHRLIYYIHNGVEPIGLIDHANMSPRDNSPHNLRIATYAQNQANRRPRKDNTSGFAGVYQLNSGNFRAKITVKRKQICLGTFRSIYEAAAVYQIVHRLEYRQFSFKGDGCSSSRQIGVIRAARASNLENYHD